MNFWLLYNFSIQFCIKDVTVFMFHIEYFYDESPLITGTGSDQTTGTIDPYLAQFDEYLKWKLIGTSVILYWWIKLIVK